MAPSSEPRPPRTSRPARSGDPLRPGDHVDAAPEAPARPGEQVTQPRLGPVGYLRFAWRQLTSMRTALFLLMLLAVAAIPGSLVPQRSSDPNGVVQYEIEHPQLFPVLDGLGVFDTYSSPWFSAVYLLLFVSLIGCIVPRTQHHFRAMRARPPRTPARLGRLAGHRTTTIAADGGAGGEPLTPAAAVEAARAQLRRAGYRTEVYGDSVSAERGYLRETGNLLFHTALVGVLLAVGIGGGFGYNGQRVVVEGQTFSNVLSAYDSFNPGRWFDESQLVPYSLTLDRFTTEYEEENQRALGQPTDYTADVTARTRDGEPSSTEIKVNEPLHVGGTNVYLLGNGYAVDVTVRDGEGNVAFRDVVPFLPQDENLTSQGVLKVPDALPEQLGMIGFFYPTAVDADDDGGILTSTYPDTLNPVLSLNVFRGDLGLDDGIPRSVYALDTDDMTQVAGLNAGTKALQLRPGETQELPDGLGSVTFEGVQRFASFDVHHDPSQLWVGGAATLAFVGLLVALFVPRRRVWVKASSTPDGVRLEYAGLARGEDPTLERAVGEIARAHLVGLGVSEEAARTVARDPSGSVGASPDRPGSVSGADRTLSS